MDNAEAQRIILEGLRNQGEYAIAPSPYKNENCRYRLIKGDKILKCAAGQLIPDHLYDPSMEFNAFDIIIKKTPELQELLQSVDVKMVIRAQSLHDGFATSNQPFQRLLDELNILFNE